MPFRKKEKQLIFLLILVLCNAASSTKGQGQKLVKFRQNYIKIQESNQHKFNSLNSSIQQTKFVQREAQVFQLQTKQIKCYRLERASFFRCNSTPVCKASIISTQDYYQRIYVLQPSKQNFVCRIISCKQMCYNHLNKKFFTGFLLANICATTIERYY